MADKKFNVELTAVDKFTANMDKFNKKIERMMAPVTKLQARVNQVTASIAKNPIAKLMKNIGSATQLAYRGLTALLNPFMIFIGAGSIAGMTRIAGAWAELGYNIRYASRQMGMGTTQLQQFQSAAALLHMDPATATSALSGLGQHIFDAQRTGNMEVDSLLAKLKMNIKHTPTGEVDSLDSAYQIADAFQNNPKFKNYQLRYAVESALGITDLAPALNAGRKGIQAAMAQGQIANPAQSGEMLAKRNELFDETARLSESFKGLANFVEDRLIPSFIPAVRWMSNTLTTKRAGIGRHMLFASSGSFGLVTSLASAFSGSDDSSNNPTNLSGWGGTTGVAAFKSPTAGMLHAVERLRFLGQGGVNDISGLMQQWDAGKSKSDIDDDISVVSNESSYGRSEKLDLNDPEVLKRILPGLIMAEKNENNYDRSITDKAVDAGMSETPKMILDINLHGHNPTVTARDGKGNLIPASVRTSGVGRH